MTAMLDRLANEMAAAFSREGGDYARDLDWKAVARASLLAIRTPDSQTLAAGEATGDQYEGCDPEACWPAMIDAILKG